MKDADPYRDAGLGGGAGAARQQHQEHQHGRDSAHVRSVKRHVTRQIAVVGAMRRRILLGAGAVAAAAAGLAGYRSRTADPPVVPDAPAGVERFEQRWSAARGRTVGFYTAAPAGHGTGRGLPVCLVLHGGSKTPADFAGLGLGRFLTDAVRRGAPPFVLAGADGGRLGWRPSGGDDPQRLVHEEIPFW